MKKTPALDIFSLWSTGGMRSVTASGDNVTMTFAQPAQIYFFYFAEPDRHRASAHLRLGRGSCPSCDMAGHNPVGTGPFTVSPCNTNNIQYVANPHYWMPGRPYIQKVEYPAYLGQRSGKSRPRKWQGHWGNQYIPNIKQFYLAKSPTSIPGIR